MQAIKDKLHDMSAMRKAKAEAKEEEKAEKELAKARVGVAREVRMAREAEAAMDLHVQKAAEKAADHERKHPPTATEQAHVFGDDIYAHDSLGRDAAATPTTAGYNSAADDPMYAGGASARETGAVPPSNNNLL